MAYTHVSHTTNCISKLIQRQLDIGCAKWNVYSSRVTASAQMTAFCVVDKPMNVYAQMIKIVRSRVVD